MPLLWSIRAFGTFNTRKRVLDSHMIITINLVTYILIFTREITRYNKVVGLGLNSSLEASSDVLLSRTYSLRARHT